MKSSCFGQTYLQELSGVHTLIVGSTRFRSRLLGFLGHLGSCCRLFNYRLNPLSISIAWLSWSSWLLLPSFSCSSLMSSCWKPCDVGDVGDVGDFGDIEQDGFTSLE